MVFKKLFTDDDAFVKKVFIEEYGFLFELGWIYPDFSTRKKIILAVLHMMLLHLFIGYDGVLYMVTVFLSFDDISLLVQSIHYASLNFLAISWMWVMLFNRYNITKCYKVFASTLFTYDDDTEIYRAEMKQNKTRQWFRKYVIKLSPISTSVVVAIVEVGASVFDQLIGSKDQSTNDGIYTKSGVSLNLPLHCWIPYGTDTRFKQITAFLSKFCGGISDALVISAGFSVILELSLVLLLELNMLLKSIELLQERSLVKYRKFYGKRGADIRNLREDPEFSKCYQMCLRENAIHYEKILEFFNSLQNVASMPIFFCYFSGTVLLALALSSCIFGNDVGLIGSRVALISIEISVVFFFSACGEEIKQTSDKIRFVLYSTNWIYADKASSKYLQIMLSRAQRPLLLMAGGLLPTTLETFSNVMNSAYSYFNLIYASNSD